VSRLSAEVARLYSQLEKGEVVKQNVEYELMKMNKELAAEQRLRLEHDATSGETVANLQRMLSVMQHIFMISTHAVFSDRVYVPTAYTGRFLQ